MSEVKHIPGTYYTVNPQAVNEPLDVFTANRRDVAIIQARLSNSPLNTTCPVGVVAVGALLVGSIFWDKEAGQAVEKGEGLGGFKYGGSTVIVIFPEGKVQWDEDLKRASCGASIEMLVQAGEQIGRAVR